MEEYTVSRLSALIQRTMETSFNNIIVRAEVSSLKVATSGHVYFTLKDSDGSSVIDAVCWKGIAQRQSIKLEVGMEIKCQGKVTTYPAGSRYQFMVDGFELAGMGALLKMLEERKRKLAEEGLFDASRKKQLPFIPKLIGVITSPTGAVIRDILHRLRQRFPRHVLLWPVLVQGTEAAGQIVSAIQGMNSLTGELKPDVIIVARGGGSFEDLMPFNDENVVRATAASEIPIISAVGHETDTTLIDYASDLRAPTPTAAAEFAVPERLKLHGDVSRVFSRLNNAITSRIDKNKLALSSHKVLNLQTFMMEKTQRSDYAFERVLMRMQDKIAYCRVKTANLMVQKPTCPENVKVIFQKMSFLFDSQLEGLRSKLMLICSSMEANSYSKILKKGFAFVEGVDGAVVSSAKQALNVGDFNLVFADGKVRISKKASQMDLF